MAGTGTALEEGLACSIVSDTTETVIRCPAAAERGHRENLQLEFSLIFKPLLDSRSWHRSPNPRKLVEVKFSHVSRNTSFHRTVKLYSPPDVSKNDFQFFQDRILKLLV